MNKRNFLDRIGITVMPLNIRNIGITILILVYVFIWGCIITVGFAANFDTNNQSIETPQYEDEHMYDVSEHTPPELKILWRNWQISELLGIQAVLTVFFGLLLYVRE